MLSEEALAALYAHAEAGYPEEVCGWVTDDAVIPCENELHARAAYRFSARDTMRLDESLRSASPARVVYHSHVDANGAFSDDDRRHAAPAGALLWPVDWLVVEVRNGKAVGARCYRWRERLFELVESHVTGG
ncbi:MAG: Mov34/MPN/PAD-1 family protein [Polyangia bacterium]